MKDRGTRSDAPLQSAPWITAEGYFDPSKFPIERVLVQALSSDDREFRAGCSMLGSMVNFDRLEAGVYLLGLFQYYSSDLRRLAVVVEQLGQFHHETAAVALLSEFRRVKSSNATRGYLKIVLEALSRFPGSMVQPELEELATDTSFSPKLRAMFRKVSELIVR